MVFISHDSRDAEIAEAFSKLIASVSAGVLKSFRSSDKKGNQGIEYGIGAIPLGGYVKIPGMHRPAPSDLDVQLGPALSEAPALFPKVARVKRALEAGDLDGARDAVPELERMVEEVNLSTAAARTARRAVGELRDGLAKDAYWRQPTWKRVAVIFAGPGTKLLILCHRYTISLQQLTGFMSKIGIEVTVLTGPSAHIDEEFPEQSDFEIEEVGFCGELDRWLEQR